MDLRKQPITRSSRVTHRTLTNTAIEYKVQWERELDRRKQLGIEAPDPIPHPDHIRIDMDTGRVRILGPFTKDDIPKWEMFRARKQECDATIAEIQANLKSPKMRKCRDLLLNELAHDQRIREIICKVLPD